MALEIPGRTWNNGTGYRYGWGGHEKDNEIKGDGNSIATHFRLNDPRTGRWFTMDPVTHFSQSPYVSMDNDPINLFDPWGADSEGSSTPSAESNTGSSSSSSSNGTGSAPSSGAVGGASPKGGGSSGQLAPEILVEADRPPKSRSSGFNVAEDIYSYMGTGYTYRGEIGEFRIFAREPGGEVIEYLAIPSGGDPVFVMGSDGLNELARDAERYYQQAIALSWMADYPKIRAGMFADPSNTDNIWALNEAYNSDPVNWYYGISGFVLGLGYVFRNDLKYSVKSGVNSLRKSGLILESIDDVMANPNLLKGKSPLQVEGLLGKTKGWKVETLGQGRAEGTGWLLREYTIQGNPTGRQLRWHPGGSRKGGEPYWRVVGYNGDLGGVIR